MHRVLTRVIYRCVHDNEEINTTSTKFKYNHSSLVKCLSHSPKSNLCTLCASPIGGYMRTRNVRGVHPMYRQLFGLPVHISCGTLLYKSTSLSFTVLFLLYATSISELYRAKLESLIGIVKSGVSKCYTTLPDIYYMFGRHNTP